MKCKCKSLGLRIWIMYWVGIGTRLALGVVIYKMTFRQQVMVKESACQGYQLDGPGSKGCFSVHNEVWVPRDCVSKWFYLYGGQASYGALEL